VAANPGADLHVLPDGERAIKLFHELDIDDSLPVPDLVIIDINLPRKHGSEVLAGMRKSRRLANTMALAITSSESERDRDRMAALGISEYFQKPSEYNEFMKLGDIVAALLARAAGLEER
jgi:DNA-binding response OmpR family regulator